MKSIRFAMISLALVINLGAISVVDAQSWPTKPVKLIAVFPAGGSVDQVARILAQQLTEQTGQSFIVDNRGGASGSIGTAALAKADPDGYTLGVVFDTHAVNPSLIPGMPFDTLRDLTPLMLVGTGAMALVTNVNQPYKSFRDVVAAAKAKPGSVSYGTIGAGSLGHLTMTQLGNQLGVEFNHIPYRGGGPLMNDAIGNQVPLAIGSVFLVYPHVESGRVRAIAVTSAARDPKLPNVETIASQGVRGLRGVHVVGRLRSGQDASRAFETHLRRARQGGQGPGSEGQALRTGNGSARRAARTTRHLRARGNSALGQGHQGQQHQAG